MKKLKIIAIFLCLATILTLISCAKKEEYPDFSQSDYKENTALGEGSRSFTLLVKSGENEVTFTIRTEKENVGDALLELGLISGEEGEYGLYVTEVNGITADYDKDKSYWLFNIEGSMASTSVTETPITEGGNYSLVYTK